MIAQIQKGGGKRRDNNHTGEDVNGEQLDTQGKVNPLAVIAKKILNTQLGRGSMFTSEGDLSGKTTTANTHVGGKQQLIDKAAVRSDEILISEEEINKKREILRRNMLDMSEGLEELDNKE